MKLVKRSLALILALLMVVALLAGCGNTEDKEDEQTEIEYPDYSRTAEAHEAKTVDYNKDYTKQEMLGESAYAEDLYGTGAVGTGGAAACASSVISQIGVEVMQKGGNAIDAMVAMIYGVGLVEPSASSIGGTGSMMIYLAKENRYFVLEYFSQAGENAIPGKLSISRDQPVSAQNIPVPGIVYGTCYAQKTYGSGKLSLQEVLQPVIDLANNGFTATSRYASIINNKMALFQSQYPETTAKLYGNADGSAITAGQTITNPDLAKTYQMIAEGGSDAFYKSDFTKSMVEYIKSQGGVLTTDDFAKYTCVEREPLTMDYHGYTIYTVGGPSNGGLALVESLGLLKNVESFTTYERDSWEAVQIINDAFAIGHRDAMSFMADPDYYNLPIADMLSEKYLTARSKQIVVGDVINGAVAGPFTATLTETGEAVKASFTKDSGGTTHLVAADSEGNWVSSTDTLGLSFGSALVCPGTGFCMTAHLNNLTNSKGAVINMMMPGIRCRTTTCPTLIVDNNTKLPVAAVGSPGDWTLVNGTLNTVINYIDYKMTMAEAVLAPRSCRDMASLSVVIEPGYSEETINGLATAGFSVEVSSTQYSTGVGTEACIEKRADGKFYAIGDPRRDYGSAAYDLAS